ncbi:MAG: preprotein translocase subunit SecG [Chloroflexi bacterium]|nr:preprotein translocase subunit SecG [Chloroflexota bacterium]
MGIYLSIAQLIVSITLIALIVVQSRTGGLGSVFGGDTTIYKTRRGMERTLFNLTVIFSVLFLVIALLSVIQTKAG